MTTLNFTPEEAQALAQQYDLLVHETINLPWVWEIAERVHTERVRRLFEWSQTSDDIPPLQPPCCPVQCPECDDAHTCFEDEDGICVLPGSEGLEWSDDDGILAQIPFDVLWANDEAMTEALISTQVTHAQDSMRAVLERMEMAERAHLAELQHKYGEQS